MKHSESAIQSTLCTLNKSLLEEAGFTQEQVTAIDLDAVAARVIVDERNRLELSRVTGVEQLNDTDRANYETLLKGKYDLNPKDTLRLMRASNLASVVLSREIGVSHDDTLKHDYNNQAANPEVRVARSRSVILGEVGVTGYIVKQMIGTDLADDGIALLRRQSFASVGARETDVKQLLGLEDKHPLDSREVPLIVPISTTHIAFRK